MIRLKHFFILVMTTILIISMSGCIIYFPELSYDDGVAEQGMSSLYVGQMLAVRFTPPKKCLCITLLAKFYIYSDPARYKVPATFKVHVMDSTHEDLIIPFEATPTSKGWFEVELSHLLIVSGEEPEDFYIAIEYVTYDEHPIPAIGCDTSSDAGRSEYTLPFTPGQQPPYNWTKLSFNLMIRAVIYVIYF